jgi:hypothetical protein
MKTMSEPFEQAAKDATAFQKICLEGMSKAIQAALNSAPGSAPPEMLREMRAGIFETLAESWDEFMRSPQFLAGMRQWTENAITFRKLSNEFMGRMRNEVQAPSCNDLDTVMLTVRHMEKRLLDRLDEISAKLAEFDGDGRGPVRAKQKRRVVSKDRKPGRMQKPKPVEQKGGASERSE